MNIGFLSAINFGSYDCVIFHDVDMLLEDDRHIYRCSDKIRHMGANVDKFEYKYVYIRTACSPPDQTRVGSMLYKVFGELSIRGPVASSGRYRYNRSIRPQ